MPNVASINAVPSVAEIVELLRKCEADPQKLAYASAFIAGLTAQADAERQLDEKE